MTGKRKARLARNLSDRSQMQQARQALAGKAWHDGQRLRMAASAAQDAGTGRPGRR